MRRLVSGMLFLLMLLGSFAAPFCGKVVKVDADMLVVSAISLWTDTRLTVNVGDSVIITATGSWTWSTSFGWFGPQGKLPWNSSDAGDNFLYEANHGELIAFAGPTPYQGHFGDSGFFPQHTGYWIIGSSATFVSDKVGELWLGINDDAVTKGTGDNGGTVTASITIVTPDFEVSASPTEKTASPARASSFTITVKSLGGFNLPVSLSASTDSAELTASFSNPTVTPPPSGSVQSTMDISVLSTELKTHTILIYGQYGAISHFVSVSLKVRFLSVPYYNQGNTLWCGPTSIAMVAKYYGISVHKWDVANGLGLGHDQGLLLPPFGFPADQIIGYLQNIGLSGEEKHADLVEIEAMLDANKPVIIAVPWPIGHVFVITGYVGLPGGDATVFLNDPSGRLFEFLRSRGIDYSYNNPFVQDWVQWSDIQSVIDGVSAPGEFIIGVSRSGHTASPMRGTLNLIGDGPLEKNTMSITHKGSTAYQGLYVFESGHTSNSPLDNPGLTWRSSPPHLRVLDPSDYIEYELLSYLIENPTDSAQQYYFEITSSKDGLQKGTTGRVRTPSILSRSHADPPLNDVDITKIISESGEYVIKLLLCSSPVGGDLLDEIDLPPIRYVPLTNLSSLLTVTAHCPVYLDLYDKNGKCVGYNATSGIVENQIDKAFWESNQTILVFDPSNTYNLEVTGTDNGTFTSEISWQDATGAMAIISFLNGTITEKETQTYSVGANANVTLTSILPSKTLVFRGYDVQINTTLADLGGPDATFNVTLYANDTIIGTESMLNVSGWTSTNVCFTWNANGLAYGNYTISAYASLVQNETNTVSNSYSGLVYVTIPGDLNGDFIVDIYDAILLANTYNSQPSSPNWKVNADINGDNIVDIYDAIIMANHFNQHYP